MHDRMLTTFPPHVLLAVYAWPEKYNSDLEHKVAQAERYRQQNPSKPKGGGDS